MHNQRNIFINTHNPVKYLHLNEIHLFSPTNQVTQQKHNYLLGMVSLLL